jgi:peptidyl-prolyl cis-trans isomerase SurA
MKKTSLVAGTLFLAGMWACKSTKTPQPVLGTIGSDPIYSNEFTYVYNKNNANSKDAYSKESLEEYLKLYTNFRLKVKAAESLGIDTTSSFNKELDGYKKQLAQPYLSEKDVTEKYTREAYERLKEEINASHILISLKPEANPEDTLKAFKTISDLRERAAKGEDFGKLASQYSEDPSAKTNQGNLGYFTALQMVYPFEDAAYNTKVGEISNPVRTRFGYHILKVHNRRPSQGQARVAHIMIRSTEGMAEADSVAARQKIDELHKRLKQGEKWDDLVKQFSDDINSRDKGGELPWFSTGRMIPSFEEAAFALKDPGQVSDPVQTPYGWHIIKLIEKKGLEPFEEIRPKIKSKVSRDRAELNKKVLITRLKKENGFEEFPIVVKKVVAVADSNLIQGKWEAPADGNNSVLFVIKGEKYTADKFYKYVKAQQRPKSGIAPVTYMNNLYEDYKQASIIEFEEKHLGEKYEDYKMLVKEYRDGILLFQLMDEKVWTKAIQDTAGLNNFFSKNREKYKWGERAQVTIFNAADTATLRKVKQSLKVDYYNASEPELEPVYYAASVDTLNEQNIAKLNKLVPYLISKNDLVVRLSGGASSKESEEVANKRIQKVKEYLLSRNVKPERIVIGGITKTADKPKVAENEKDRKVSFELLSASAKVLEKQFNKEAPLTLQVTEGMFQKGENEILNLTEWKPDTTVVTKNDRHYLVLIKKIEEPRLKRLDETKGVVISDYQEYLEKEWIGELRSKYPVQVNQTEVEKLIKK